MVLLVSKYESVNPEQRSVLCLDFLNQVKRLSCVEFVIPRIARMAQYLDPVLFG